MKKLAIRIVITLAAALGLLLAAVPYILPPLVQRFAKEKLSELGFPSLVRMDLGYAWCKGPELAGTLNLRLMDSPVEARASFGIGLGTWHARLRVPTAELTESDPTFVKLLSSNPLPKGVSNLTFRASLSLEASAERTWRTPVPVWSAKAPVRIDSAALVREERPIAVEGLSVTLGASGIADRREIAPMFLRTASANVNGFAMTNLTAAIRATERALLVTEAKAGFCDGTVNLYSVFLDPKTLNAGFTLFLDDIDAGKVLSLVKGFRGEASGRLHGKLKLFLKDGGKKLRLGNAFLYSTPGETGKLKMTDAAVVTDNLALAGIDESSRQNVANALTDLDYSVLKLDLKHGAGRTATLGVRLDGTATRGKMSAPVNLNLNFNGDIEQILNTGLDLSNRLKGKMK